MRVIDVDSHFEPGESWLASYPDLIGRVPRRQSLADLVVEMTYGDLFRRVPEDQRPASEDIVPHALVEALTAERDGEAARRGDPATERLDPSWRRRLEDVLWSLLNAPEFIFTP